MPHAPKKITLANKNFYKRYFFYNLSTNSYFLF